MSYVILADDGSLIVVDGGHDDESDALLEFLSGLTKSKIPHVDMWIITHAHLDHTFCLLDMAKRHYKDFTLGTLCFNFPDEKYFALSQPVALEEIKQLFSALENLSCNYFKPVRNTAFNFGNTKLEFLFSWEELEDLGSAPLNINDTSLVFTVSDPTQRVIFLADAEERTAKILNDNYGAKLKSEVCQLAHHGCTHGWNDEVSRLYENIAPKIILWPARWSNAEKYLDFSLINRYIFKELDIQDVYLSGNGTSELILPVEVRNEPYLPTIPQGKMKDGSYVNMIPLLEREADITSPDDAIWEKCLEIPLVHGECRSEDKAFANVFVGAFKNKLFFKLSLFKDKLPSAPCYKSSLDTNCFRFYFTTEPVFDYGVFWDQIKGKNGAFNDLKLYFEKKDNVGENTRTDISKSAIHPFEGGCTVCAELKADEDYYPGKRLAMVIEANAVDSVGGRRTVSLRNVGGEDGKIFYIKPAGLCLFEIS